MPGRITIEDRRDLCEQQKAEGFQRGVMVQEMAAEFVSCPSCERKLRIRDELQGHPVKCPACQTIFQPAPDPVDAPSQQLPQKPLFSLAKAKDIPIAESVATDQPGDSFEENPDPVSRGRYRRHFREDELDEEEDGFEDRSRRRRRSPYQPHRGTLVLVMGLLGIIGFFTPITSLIAWILGSMDLREMKAGRMDPEGESSTRVGYILGIIATLLFGALVLLICGIIVVMILDG